MRNADDAGVSFQKGYQKKVAGRRDKGSIEEKKGDEEGARIPGTPEEAKEEKLQRAAGAHAPYF